MLTRQFHRAGYGPVTDKQMALEQIYHSAQQQAQVLSYSDLFWIFSMAALCVAPLVFLMRRSVSEKEASRTPTEPTRA